MEVFVEQPGSANKQVGLGMPSKKNVFRLDIVKKKGGGVNQ